MEKMVIDLIHYAEFPDLINGLRAVAVRYHHYFNELNEATNCTEPIERFEKDKKFLVEAFSKMLDDKDYIYKGLR